MSAAKDPPLESVSIREHFDAQLCNAGVDCFAVFAEDLWQPGLLIPQDVDTTLFYPEATYAAPDSAFHDDTKKRLGKSPFVHGINSAFFEDSTDGPASPTEEIARTVYSDYGPLFQSFLEREHIVATAIFSPENPLIAGNALTELLFFNFRSPQSFTTERQSHLTSLAHAILRHIPWITWIRNRRAYGPARKTIRAFSCLVQSLNDQLRNPATAPDSQIYAKIATQLHDVLALQSGKGVDSQGRPKSIVSIYLREFTAKEPSNGQAQVAESEPHLMLRGSSLGDRHQNIKQRLYDSSTASVTVCTTITNCPHLLQHIDPFTLKSEFNTRHIQETSIDLTSLQVDVAKTDPDVFNFISPVELNRWRRELREAPTVMFGEPLIYDWRLIIDEADQSMSDSGPRRSRLILWTPLRETSYPEQAVRESLLAALENTALGRRWPWLTVKLRARIRIQYAHIFGGLDKDWELPSSEVCVPIRFAGQCIGCVNIETSNTDRFNFTYVGLLSSFAAVVGMMAARELDLNMSAKMQRVLRAIHSREFVPDGSPVDRGDGRLEYSSHILEDRYELNALARSLAQACWAERCLFVSTGSHEDDPTRFLGTSDTSWNEANDWQLPRSNGLTAWLASQPEEILGAVIDVDGPKQQTVFVRSGSHEPNGDILASLYVDDTTTLELPRNRDYGQRSAKRLVLCRLSSFGAGGRQLHFSRTLIILVYARRMFALRNFGVDRVTSRRDSFLTYIYALCQRCSGIADHWNSSLLERLTIQENVSHGTEFLAIEQGWASLAQDAPAEQQQGARLLLRNIWVSRKVAAYLSVPSGRLNADLPMFDKLSLSSLVDEAVRSSKAINDSSHVVRKYVQEEIGQIRFEPDAAVLFYYLATQAIVNAREHAKTPNDSSEKKIGVVVEPVIRNGISYIGCRIQDNGVGFPPAALADRAEYRRRLPVLIAGRRGRGLDLMSRAARRLNRDAPIGAALRLGNSTEGGAFIEFDVPSSRICEQ